VQSDSLAREPVGIPDAIDANRIRQAEPTSGQIFIGTQGLSPVSCAVFVDLDQPSESASPHHKAMQSFVVYRCHATSMKVQVLFAAKDSAQAEDRFQNYQSVSCPACGATHFVNVKTGKLLGRDTE